MKKIAELSELSLADLVLSENNLPFLKDSRPRVSKHDFAIPLCAILCGVEERRIKGGRETRLRKVEKNEEKRRGKLYPRFLSIAVHRGTVVHIRASRKIDKKRRFVKCRGRFSLLAMADRGRRWKWQSFHWVLTIVPLSIGTGLLNPFAASRCRVSGTLMPCDTRAEFFVFVSRTMGFVLRAISWAPQSVYSAHHNCRLMINNNVSSEFFRQKRKIKLRHENNYYWHQRCFHKIFCKRTIKWVYSHFEIFIILNFIS